MSEDGSTWTEHAEGPVEAGGHMSARSQPLAGGSQLALANRNINNFSG